MKTSKTFLSIALAASMILPTIALADTRVSIEVGVGGKLILSESYVDDGSSERDSKATGFYKKSKHFKYIGETDDETISLEMEWRVNPVDSNNPTMISSISATLLKNGKVTTIGQLTGSYVTATDGAGVAIRNSYPSKGNDIYTARFPHSEILPNAYITVIVDFESTPDNQKVSDGKIK